MKTYLPILPLIALLAAGLPAPARAEVVYPPGLRIGIEPPPGMKLNTQTLQFEDPDRKASILLLELPIQAYQQIQKAMFDEAAKPGVTVLKRESFPYTSGIGFYSSMRVMHEGTAFRKWTLLASTAASPATDFAAMISMQVPEDAMAIYSEEAARKALASVTFRAPPIDERLGLIPFTLSELGGFKIDDVAPTGVVMTEATGATDLPRIVVTMGAARPDTADERARFAQELLRQVPLRNLAFGNGEAMRIRGQQGYEIKAQAKEAGGGDITVIQWVRFELGKYIGVLAAARKEDWDRAYPRFRAVRDGIEPR